VKRDRAIRPFPVLAILLMAHSGVNAQLLDTSDVHLFKPVEVSILQAEDITTLVHDTIELDTQLNLFYNYYPAYDRSFPMLDQGQEATPILPLNSSLVREVNLNLGTNHMAPYFYDNMIHVYQTPRPFTSLTYSQGPLEFINVGVTHAQQISKRLSFGLDYRRIKNQNRYYSNLQNLSSVRMGNLFNSKFYTNYYTAKRKYELVASYVWNKSKNAETGGVSNDTVFNTLSGRQKENNIPARYTNAFNTHAQNNFKLTQYFRPGGKSTDSTLDMSLAQFRNHFFITTQFRSERVEFEDGNPDSLNYGYSLQAFRDSIHLRTLSNELGYTVKLDPVTLSASAIHSYNKVYLNGIVDFLNNIYLQAKAKVKIKGFSINGKGKLGVLGYNLGDYSIDGEAAFQINSFALKAHVLSQLVEPNFLEQQMYSPATVWNNTFQKISVNRLGGEAKIIIGNHHLNGRASVETIGNLVYYTNEREIAQTSGLTTLLQIHADYAFASKYFGAHTTVILQQSSNQTVLPRPTTAATGNIYTRFRLFQKNLGIELGARTFWYSSFNSPTYTPYTRQWHTTDQRFEMTAPINPYVMAKVKSFFFGLEMFHVQQGWATDAYYSAPHFPLMPRSLRLNFRWDLSN
jgi:hypothetical protein